MNALIQLYERDLAKLHTEISLFDTEDKLWQTKEGIINCAGNLALHLVGNLNHFIGSVIGKTGYVRHREAEFNDKNVAKEKLLSMIEETSNVVATSLSQMPEDLLKQKYPIVVFEDEMTYEFFLLHLLGHLNYHLGQINYLRRILN